MSFEQAYPTVGGQLTQLDGIEYVAHPGRFGGKALPRDEHYRRLKPAAVAFEGGPVIPPLKRNCIGSLCIYGAGCEIERHHLYFAAPDYRELAPDEVRDVSDEFRCCGSSQIPLMSCAHDVAHEDDYVPMPSSDYMHQIVAEDKILNKLGAALSVVSCIDKILWSEVPPTREELNEAAGVYRGAFVWRLMRARDSINANRWHQKYFETFAELEESIGQLALVQTVPDEILKRAERKAKHTISRLPPGSPIHNLSFGSRFEGALAS
jgi:hypothetical protein